MQLLEKRLLDGRDRGAQVDDESISVDVAEGGQQRCVEIEALVEVPDERRLLTHSEVFEHHCVRQLVPIVVEGCHQQQENPYQPAIFRNQSVAFFFSLFCSR